MSIQRSIFITAVLTAAALPWAAGAVAQTGAVHVLASNGMKAVLDQFGRRRNAP